MCVTIVKIQQSSFKIHMYSNVVPTHFILLHHEGRTMFSMDEFKLVQIPVLFSHFCPINGSGDLPCMHCCPSAHLHWPLKSVNQYDCLSWHKASNKMDCSSATIPESFFSPPLSLCVSGGGRYCKRLLICVLLDNDDPVNSQRVFHAACIVFMADQMCSNLSCLIISCETLARFCSLFYKFCHIHNVWLLVVSVQILQTQGTNRVLWDWPLCEKQTPTAYLSLSVPPLLSQWASTCPKHAFECEWNVRSCWLV